MAGLLLFAKDPAFWHPRCGIDFVKYEGTERQHGASLNVVKRIRFEAPSFASSMKLWAESRNTSGSGPCCTTCFFGSG